LKNKKGAQTQKFVQQITHQVKNAGQSAAKLEAQKHVKKKTAEDELLDLNKLLRPVTEMPKVARDVDPKSVLCLFFKQGTCHKGNKSKFSHDLAVENKTAKRNIYVDSRDIEAGDETMDNWDETKLNEVAEKKHGETDRERPNQTEIVCKYFIEAVENSKYGWFWECENGSKCIYRHALPPGFVLKKDRKKLEEMEKGDQISLEELIENERNALSSKNLTKVTLESFVAWKKRKLREKKTKLAEEDRRKRTNYKTGKQLGLSGRDLFTFNPDLVGDDDDEADDGVYAMEEGDDVSAQNNGGEMVAREIDEQMFCDFGELDEEDDTGTLVVEDPLVEFNEQLFDTDEIDDETLEKLDAL